MKRLPRRRRARGFTLMEIMIVVAIIGILAALAIPSFNHYRLRAKSAEHRTMISAIRAAQNNFYAEMDQYASIPAHPLAPFSSYKRSWFVGLAPCSPLCDRFNVPACNSYKCLSFEPAGDVYYTYATPASPPPGIEFAIGVIGDVDGNGIDASYTFQSANGSGPGGLGTVPDTVSACVGQGIGYPAYQIWECVPGAW